MTAPPAPSPMAAERAGEAHRVWLVGDFAAGRQGNHSVAADLARRLEDRGLQVGTTSHRSSSAARVWDMAATTWRRRRSLDVAVVDVYSGRAFVWAEAVCAILRRAGVPYALVLRGGGLPAFARRHPRRVRRLFQSAASVVALSGYLGDLMAAYGGAMRTLPNPIDIAAYPVRIRTSAAPRLMWLRTFHEIYNPTMAPRVLARLRDEFPDARLTMVGPDKGDGSLERTRRLAAELGVLDRIEFVGPVPKSEVGAQLQRGDVFLNTPRIDNVPISVLEAAACGLCIVSTDVGGIPYLVDDGRQALLVGSDDAEAMATAVARCCREPALAEALSRGARSMAGAHDWESIMPRWVDLLGDLVRESAA